MSPRGRLGEVLGTPGKALAVVQDRVLANMATGRGLAAVDPARVLTAGKEQLDSRLFGPGFETMVWWALKQSVAVEIERTSRFRLVLESAVGREALSKLTEDTRYLIAATKDIDRDVDRAIRTEQPLSDEERAWLLVRQDIAVQSLSLLVLINDRLDVGIRQGAVLRYANMKVMLKQARVKRLRSELRALEAALEAALDKLDREWKKTIINTSITAVTLLNPAMGLAARGSLELGQIIVNWALSDPPESISDVDTTAPARRAIQRFAEEIGKADDVSRAAQVVEKAPAHANTVVGFVFDARAVVDSHRDADEIVATMERASQALDDALADLERARPFIEDLHRAIEAWEVELARQDIDASSTRRRLDALRREHGYSPTH
jgi:exonuclease VII small subunit